MMARATDSTGSRPAPPSNNLATQATLLTADDFYWFNQGTHQKLYEKLGAHCGRLAGVEGTYFAVWAPNAQRVAVDIYDNPAKKHQLHSQGPSGIWSGFVPSCARTSVQVPHRIAHR